MHVADTCRWLYDDVLVIRKVTILSTGSVRCWRITTNLADRSWLTDESDEHVLDALFAFVTARTHNLASIKNFVLEADVFGCSWYVFDFDPPEGVRCADHLRSSVRLGAAT